MPHRSWSTSAHRRLVIRVHLAKLVQFLKGDFSGAFVTKFSHSFPLLFLGKEIRSILFEQFAKPDTRSGGYFFCNWRGMFICHSK